MKAFQLSFVIFVILLLTASSMSVYGGTLVAGSSVAVQSNYQGFDGLSLVGTWNTVPTVSDILTISEDDLPANYGMPNTISITVPPPTFQQVLSVSNQKPIYNAQFQDQVFYYCSGTACLSNDRAVWGENCLNKLDTWLQTNGNLKRYPGTKEVVTVTGYMCHVQLVTSSSQVGWVGDVAPSGLNYYQDIIVGSKGTLHLKKDKTTNQLVDTIPGVGRATFLGANQFTDYPLQTNYIHAFQPGSVFNVNAWSPYHDSTGIAAYQLAELNVLPLFQSGKPLLTATQITKLKTDLSKMQFEADRIKSASSSLPSEWTGQYTGQITKQANEIVVTLKNSVYTSNIQLILAGKSFGLYLATGHPKIISMDSSISFEETKQGYINYVVQNDGSAQGSFVLHATCTGQAVGQDVYFEQMQKDEKASGKMIITSKSTKLGSTEQDSCVVSFKETNTKVEETRTVSVTLKTKDLCASGQQTDPFMSGSSYTVNTLNTKCEIVSTKSCAADSLHSFQKDSAGIWQCVDQQGSAGGGVVPEDKEKTSEFSLGLFIGSLIVAIIGGSIVGYYTLPLRKMTKAGKWIHLVLILAVAVGLFFLVPIVVIGITEWIKGLFSFG